MKNFALCNIKKTVEIEKFAVRKSWQCEILSFRSCDYYCKRMHKRFKILNMKRTKTGNENKCPQYYKIGDKVEAVKLNIGAWFSADIIDIYPKPICECYETCHCLFKIIFESEGNKAEIAERKLHEIRQVTYSSLEWDALKEGMKVVINYNIKNPDQWGYWYDYIINEVYKRDDITYVKGTLLIGYNGISGKIPVEIDSNKVADVLEIRPDATVIEKERDDYETGVKPEYCKQCKNKPNLKCKKCCCCKCGLKKDFNLTVLCDECADWYHIYCINPPLKALPDSDDDWYCPKCNNEAFRAQRELHMKIKRQKKRKQMKKRTENDFELGDRKSENKVVSIRKQSEIKSKAFIVKEPMSNKICSEIPKNSAIWNDVEKLFPKYEVLRISVDLADKKQTEDDAILNPALERLIYSDEINERLWNEAKMSIEKGKQAFLSHVRSLFTCSICCNLMKEPITLSCKHSFCIACFFRALSVNVYNCALCRKDVIHTEHYLVNENLSKALELLFPK